jgi:large subunit ribosomal protein L30
MEKKISIKLVKSPLGRIPKQRATIKALGLGRMHSVSVLPANACVLGMVAKVSHLVKVEEI